MNGPRARSVSDHYGRGNLAAAILTGLREAGKDPDALAPDDLVAVDHFHVRGRKATLELAQQVGLERGMRVLDVGGGLGGSARTLARELGCHVTVLDLTEEYCRVGEELTRRSGLSAQVVFRHGNALDVPFADESFDAAWMEHCSMNVDDKERLSSEIRRVTRPGGRLALHEIAAGPRVPIHFPVPWARDPSASFLRPAAAIRALLARAGFKEVAWSDVSARSLEWFRRQVTRATPTPLGLQLLLGADFEDMVANQVRNLDEGRIAVIMGAWERP